MRISWLSLALILTSLGILQGCTGIVVGGAAATATAVHDRRTLGVFVEDQSIEFKAAEQLASDTRIKQNGKINVTSYNRVVLMTGQVANPELRDQAERLVADLDQVRRVVNEVEIGSTATLGELTRDAALTTEIKFRLSQLDIPDFDPLRVKVVTERGVVYLMGLLTPVEAQAVTELVRYVSGVRRVVKVFEYI